jgi:nuclear pore complex protein Nup98-Nup96
MEDFKSEIENWDLGAGIYISFYLMRNKLQGDTNAMTELVWPMLAFFCLVWFH